MEPGFDVEHIHRGGVAEHDFGCLIGCFSRRDQHPIATEPLRQKVGRDRGQLWQGIALHPVFDGALRLLPHGLVFLAVLDAKKEEKIGRGIGHRAVAKTFHEAFDHRWRGVFVPVVVVNGEQDEHKIVWPQPLQVVAAQYLSEFALLERLHGVHLRDELGNQFAHHVDLIQHRVGAHLRLEAEEANLCAGVEIALLPAQQVATEFVAQALEQAVVALVGIAEHVEKADFLRLLGVPSNLECLVLLHPVAGVGMVGGQSGVCGGFPAVHFAEVFQPDALHDAEQRVVFIVEPQPFICIRNQVQIADATRIVHGRLDQDDIVAYLRVLPEYLARPHKKVLMAALADEDFQFLF